MRKQNHIKEHINHIVSSVINEYYQQKADDDITDVFDWDILNQIDNNHDKIEYCKQYFGEPIGDGLNRVVFEIDDHTVLKFEGKMAVQNRLEYDIWKKFKNNPLLPKIYGHADDFSWLWVERVIPMNNTTVNKDFINILKIPFYNNNYFKQPSIEGLEEWHYNYHIHCDREYDLDKWTPIYQNLIQNNKWIKELVNFFQFINPYEFHAGNFGIALRNNKPFIVVLDTGMY